MAIRIRWLGTALLLSLVLTATACSEKSPASGSATEGGGGGPATGTVEQQDFSFSPAEVTVTSGDGITVENVGGATHTFTVPGQDVDVTNQPGDSQEVKIYDFVCTFHESSGMTGTLTVT